MSWWSSHKCVNGRSRHTDYAATMLTLRMLQLCQDGFIKTFQLLPWLPCLAMSRFLHHDHAIMLLAVLLDNHPAMMTYILCWGAHLQAYWVLTIVTLIYDFRYCKTRWCKLDKKPGPCGLIRRWLAVQWNLCFKTIPQAPTMVL